MKALALVVQRGANIFDPLIDFDAMFYAVGSQRFFLNGEILLLTERRHTGICNHESLLRRNQPAILQVLFMRVVAGCQIWHVSDGAALLVTTLGLVVVTMLVCSTSSCTRLSRLRKMV